MRKILYFFGACLLILTSCSDDEKNTVTSVLPKRIVQKIGSEKFTEEYTYDDDKIVSIVGNFFTKYYTYTGELITKVVVLDSKGIINETIDYTYSSAGKLQSSLKTSINLENQIKVEYTHHSNNTVTYKETSINKNTGEIEDNNISGTFNFVAGNLVTIKRSDKSVITFEHDQKSNPFKNVKGLNLLLDHEEYVSMNNVGKRTYDMEPLVPYIVTKEHKYANNGFPLEQFARDGLGTEIMVQYFY